MKSILFLLFLSLTACSPAYVIRAAYEESKILLNREEISEYIRKADVSKEEQEKLALVLEAREYSKKIGLRPQGSFKYYTKLDRNEAAWVLTASPEFSLEAYSWWFPFVGSVPYKGFFEKAEAEEAAKKLQEQGMEIFIRPTDAFSTLGWFDDPLLSPVLRYDNTAIVNLVIHESFHSTHWIKGDVEANESMANYVGLRGAVGFFAEKARDDSSQLNNFQKAAENFNNEIKFAKLINAFYQELERLYQQDLPRHLKLIKKEEIFKRYNSKINKAFPFFKNISNNPELLQLKIYLGKPF